MKRLWRFLMVVLALPVAAISILLFPLVLLSILWWEIIGFVLALTPRLRFYLGRYLGAYPFSLALVLFAGTGALAVSMISPSSGWVSFRAAMSETVTYLGRSKRLALMGGLWS